MLSAVRSFGLILSGKIAAVVKALVVVFAVLAMGGTAKADQVQPAQIYESGRVFTMSSSGYSQDLHLRSFTLGSTIYYRINGGEVNSIPNENTISFTYPTYGIIDIEMWAEKAGMEPSEITTQRIYVGFDVPNSEVSNIAIFDPQLNVYPDGSELLIAVAGSTQINVTLDEGKTWKTTKDDDGFDGTITVPLSLEKYGSNPTVYVESYGTQHLIQEYPITISEPEKPFAPKFEYTGVEDMSRMEFLGNCSVAISPYDGTTVHYTQDGSEPNASSTVYNGEPIEISQTTTIKAVAVHDASGVLGDVAETTLTLFDPGQFITEGNNPTHIAYRPVGDGEELTVYQPGKAYGYMLCAETPEGQLVAFRPITDYSNVVNANRRADGKIYLDFEEDKYKPNEFYVGEEDGCKYLWCKEKDSDEKRVLISANINNGIQTFPMSNASSYGYFYHVNITGKSIIFNDTGHHVALSPTTSASIRPASADAATASADAATEEFGTLSDGEEFVALSAGEEVSNYKFVHCDEADAASLIPIQLYQTEKDDAATTSLPSLLPDASADDTPIYYNLQGQRVDHPISGTLLIELRGTHARKLLHP